MMSYHNFDEDLMADLPSCVFGGAQHMTPIDNMQNVGTPVGIPPSNSRNPCNMTLLPRTSSTVCSMPSGNLQHHQYNQMPHHHHHHHGPGKLQFDQVIQVLFQCSWSNWPQKPMTMLPISMKTVCLNSNKMRQNLSPIQISWTRRQRQHSRQWIWALRLMISISFRIWMQRITEILARVICRRLVATHRRTKCRGSIKRLLAVNENGLFAQRQMGRLPSAKVLRGTWETMGSPAILIIFPLAFVCSGALIRHSTSYAFTFQHFRTKSDWAKSIHYDWQSLILLCCVKCLKRTTIHWLMWKSVFAVKLKLTEPIGIQAVFISPKRPNSILLRFRKKFYLSFFLFCVC